ncbi:MAG: hypothetical protein QE285_10430 [Aquabacterium sp.]|nr:hypothetical protein [Aquabacterium sp.]
MTDDPLAASIDALRSGQLPADQLVARWRAAAAGWPGLPPRYAAVLEHLLAPLEASALFTEESCSFSRSDLADSLAQWLQHARAVAPGR